MSNASNGTFVSSHWRTRHSAALCLVLVLLCAAVSGLHRSSERLFWFDEIATLAVARQGSPIGIWNALHAGADAQPPPFYLLEALSGRIVESPQIAYRLPSLLGFLATPIALWCFVRKRCAAPAALVAALIPFVTPMFTLYAVEARPYALVTCCVAWAFVMWQGVGKRGRVAALALLLAAAASLNHSAVVCLLPFALGELVRTLRLRERRLRVWLALLAGCAPLAAFWPLLSRFNQDYGTSFWARPRLLDAYGELLGISERWAGPLVAVLVAASVASLLPDRQQSVRATPPEIPAEERTLVFAFACLPVVLYVVSLMLAAPMSSRYVLPAVLGISVTAAFLTSIGRSSRAAWWASVAVLSIIGLQQIDYWRFGQFIVSSVADHSDLAVLQRMVQRSDARGLPVVVSNGLRYLAMAHYEGRVSNLPFLYLPDPPGAIRSIGTDSVDRAILRLAPYLPLHVQEPAAFYAQDRVFLLFSENELWDYLPRRLVSEGHAVRLLATDGSGGANHMLYRVELQRPESPRGRLALSGSSPD